MTPQAKAALLDDLAFLRKYHYFYLRNWRDDPPLAEVASGSVMLRRLLVDRELVRCWQAAGFSGEPKIAALDLEAVLAAHGGGKAEFALAGAARLKSDVSGAAAPAPAFRVYSLAEYLESPSLLVRGTVISRREVIRYMAQQADPAAGKRDREMAERMGRLEAKANSYRQDAFVLELISIGQTVTQTPDVEKLVRALAS